MRRRLAVLLVAFVTCPATTSSSEPASAPGAAGAPGMLAEELAKLDSRVIELGTVRERPLAGMLARDVRAALREANHTDTRAWEQVNMCLAYFFEVRKTGRRLL